MRALIDRLADALVTAGCCDSRGRLRASVHVAGPVREVLGPHVPAGTYQWLLSTYRPRQRARDFAAEAVSTAAARSFWAGGLRDAESGDAGWPDPAIQRSVATLLKL